MRHSGPPARPHSPGQGQGPITQQQSPPGLGWGDAKARWGVAVTAGSAAEADEEVTEGAWLPVTWPELPGEDGFGDRWLWGAGHLAAGILRLFRCLVSANLRGQPGGLGPSPSGLRVLACPAEG